MRSFADVGVIVDFTFVVELGSPTDSCTAAHPFNTLETLVSRSLKNFNKSHSFEDKIEMGLIHNSGEIKVVVALAGLV